MWKRAGTSVLHAAMNAVPDRALSLGSLRVDRAVAAEFLEAVAPAGVEAALRAGENIVAADQTQREVVALALERARYEAARAQRQYDATEPENRLVAAELESALERGLGQRPGLGGSFEWVESVENRTDRRAKGEADAVG